MGIFSKKKEVLVCPKCASTEKEPAGNIPTDHVVGSGFTGRPLGPKLYKCKKCGYEGVFVLIDESELKDFKKKVEEEK